MINKIRTLIPMALVITAIYLALFVLTQQSLRMAANDPQVQISEDVSAAFNRGQNMSSLMTQAPFDVSQSLSPFIGVYDEAGKQIITTARIDGKAPIIPTGVFDAARKKGQYRLTLEPKKGVRLAAVITHFKGNSSGFVLAGRSLREVESRINGMMMQVVMAWIGTLVLAAIAVFIIAPGYKKQD